jgi:hypothetical protein
MVVATCRLTKLGETRPEPGEACLAPPVLLNFELYLLM